MAALGRLDCASVRIPFVAAALMATGSARHMLQDFEDKEKAARELALHEAAGQMER